MYTYLQSINPEELFGEFYQDQSINPLVPSAHKSVRIAKISILKLEGFIKEFPKSVAHMSQ